MNDWSGKNLSYTNSNSNNIEIDSIQYRLTDRAFFPLFPTCVFTVWERDQHPSSYLLNPGAKEFEDKNL